MSWRVLRVATISLWGSLLLARGDLVGYAPTNPCYHHLDAAHYFSMDYQLSNLFSLCPGQQATTCSASSTKTLQSFQFYIKLHLTMENITHSQIDAAIRTLRLRLPRGGDPMPLTIPAQQEVARETSTPLFPKNWVSHLWRGECQAAGIGKRSPKQQRLKDKERKSSQKENLQTGMRTSGETNTPPSWLAQFAQGRLSGEETNG